MLIPALKNDQKALYALFEAFDAQVIREAATELAFTLAAGEASIKDRYKYFFGMCKNKQKELTVAEKGSRETGRKDSTYVTVTEDMDFFSDL